MQIYSQYVSVSVDAVVFNPHDGVQLADFNLRLPDQAFISYFHMLVRYVQASYVACLNVCIIYIIFTS